MGWLKDMGLTEPALHGGLPEMRVQMHDYDLARMRRGSTISWPMRITINHDGRDTDYEFILIVEVR